MRGTWHVEGIRDRVVDGDVIEPGSLLEPEAEDSGHSITILLPDGQQILYECFTAKDCARGFRVPALFHVPSRPAVQMLGRVRAVLLRQRGKMVTSPRPFQIARDEAVAVLGPGNRIEIGGLAAALSDGRYFGDLRSVNEAYPGQSGVVLEKSGHSLALTVPGPGLYRLIIFDSMKWPRIDLMIAAATAQDRRTVSEFEQEHALLVAWDREYFGWPMHDFQRACLKSLMLHIPPAWSRDRQLENREPPRPGVTAEPMFAPRPGLVAGNLAVTLHCATAGAVIHYSVDTTQPVENSPIYRAPIVMTRLPLTIKAFAEAPGKKDSAVVVANFRVEDQNH